jgi:hypothetical protein
VSEKKPTLEDLVRMVCKVRARFEKEDICIRVTIESYPIERKPKPEKDKK